MDKPEDQEPEIELDLMGIPGVGMWGSVPDEIAEKALQTYWRRRDSRPPRLLEVVPYEWPPTEE